MARIHHKFDVLNLIQCKHEVISATEDQNYFVVPASPAKGILFVTNDNHEFISGHIRVRGRENGGYPYNYPEMIDAMFGKENNTIEVSSGMIRKHNHNPCFTVDINPDTKPVLVDDGQTLDSIPSFKFSRWRCDPPYNINTAKTMYGTDLPCLSNFLRLVPSM